MILELCECFDIYMAPLLATLKHYQLFFDEYCRSNGGRGYYAARPANIKNIDYGKTKIKYNVNPLMGCDDKGIPKVDLSVFRKV